MAADPLGEHGVPFFIDDSEIAWRKQRRSGVTALNVADVRAARRGGVDPPVRLRPATASDTGQVAALRAASWQAAYAGIVDAETLDAMPGVVPPWLADRCPAPAGQLSVVAEAPSGRLLGFVMAHGARDEPGVGEVGLLYVTPPAWRTGVGTALLAAAEEWFAGTGHDAAILWTFEANDRGRRFYERCGWTDDGGRSSWQVGAQQIPEVRYRRPVRLFRTRVSG